MAFSAATNLSERQEKKRLERVLSAYQDAIDHDEADREVAEFFENAEKSPMLENPEEHDFVGVEDDSSTCARIPLQELKFALYYFLTGCASSMLLPYLAVYYRQLGLDAYEIGIVKSLQPWIAIPAVPIWGYLADRWRVTRGLLIISLIGYLVCNVALAFTPKVDEVDCQTVVSRICEDPRSTVNYEPLPRFEPVTAKYALELSTLTKMPRSSINNSKVCLPSEEYLGYFYDTNYLLRVFVYMIIINIVGEIWQAPYPALGNAAVLNSLRKDKRNHFGYYKAAGAVGAAIGVFVAGEAIHLTETTYEHCGLQLSQVKYNACFVGFAVCIALVLPIAWHLDNSEKEEEENPTTEYHFRDVIVALGDLHYGSAFLAISWLSISIGVAKAFDYWYIEILGGSHSLMAWAGMLSTVVLIVTFLALPYLNTHFGHLSFLVLALVVTGIGCCLTAFITDPWWMVLPMCLRGIATATSAQSAGTYLANAVDKHHMATLQTIMAAIVFGVGNGAGSLLGGILIKAWSPFVCYSVFGVASFMFSIFLTIPYLKNYVLFHSPIPP